MPRPSRFAWAMLGLAACLTRPAWAEPVRLEAPKDIAAALAPYLPKEDLADPAARQQARRRLEKSLPDILATEGYFTPRLDFSEPDGALAVRIDPGPRTEIGAVDIAIAGKLDEDFRRSLVAGWSLGVGQPFRQADWSAAKQQVLSRLLGHGYAGASIAASRADIDPDTGQARLQASYDAGPPYRFGPLQIDGLSRYPPKLVERYNRFVVPGEPYREDRLTALQNALQSSPYFSSVQVTLGEPSPPGPDGTVTAPVRLRVQEREPHRVAFGVGASSNTGARLETNYHTADLFRNARELDTGIRLEQKRQIAYGDIFLPPSKGNYRLSFGGLTEHTLIQGLATERVALGAQRLQQRGSVEMRLSLNWQEERRRPEGTQPTLNRALVPDGMWTWRQVDSLIAPRHGFVLQARVGGAAQALLSDQDFVRLYGRYQQFLPVGRRDVFTFRAELGQTLAKSRQGIPQEYLFRAGGTNSVRGYSYQSLGVKEGSAVVGGRTLATASAEYTHWLDERWGVAAFVDAGDAADSRKGFRPALGYGLGARWKSPAGPVAVDLAYGQRSDRFQLHFSLAIPF
ncbi:MAG TPA: autotransporter assembly complex family protein [Rhodocyclaceae bacterium]|nr:autotransporter assembly complex family protein [Rhodocyclaceae bacterium]